MGPLTRVIQTGIGLAAELKAASKERKASEANVEESLTDDIRPEQAVAQNDPTEIKTRSHDKASDDDDQEDDEHFGGSTANAENEPGIAELEDAPPPYTEEELAEVDDVKYAEPNIEAVKSSGLKCPIVIPQRRPGSKTRGFVRAYAPVLADFDIELETFLGFLKAWHKSSQASPILTVLTVGGGALGNIPEPFTLLAGIAISVLSATAAEIQGRYRANSFLDQANDNLFKPRGLFCLVMSYRPDTVPLGDVAMQPVDTSNAALKWLNPPTSSFQMHKGNFRASSGISRGEIELAETAPLVYEDTGYVEIGRMESGEGKGDEGGEGREGKGSSAFKRHRKVAAAYFDKRAQAKYAYKHPDSALATDSPPQFASKYGDPTHPSVTTSYAGRASAKLKGESLADRQARRREKAMREGEGGLRGTIRRVLPESVLYLMIVNLPGEEVLEEARQATEQSAA